MKEFITFTKEILEEAHFLSIREIARQIGVRAPASKNKEQLIVEILGIQQGKIKPIPISNLGAPKKNSVDISDYYKKQADTEQPNKKDGFSYAGSEVYQTYLSDSKPQPDCFEITGVLELHPQGYGFLRTNNYENSDNDGYVSGQNIKKFNLRRGDKVTAIAKVTREGDSAALQSVVAINDLAPELFLKRTNFDDLVPFYPTERIKLERENEQNNLAIRLIDLFCPLGMGQRGLIVAPPKTGKTTLLKLIAQSIEKNYKDVKLIVLLIDERPEEVTDIKRSINGEVVFSTFDEGLEHHIRASELVINRAKRLVEVGQNVVILMDSITRLARAYNSVVESSGKVLTGGIDPTALHGPKRFFGAARNIESGGSLTILSTALVDTGSKMDDVIFEEFKGTGNMEIHLSRELSEKRIFPAIDIYKSGTRRDDLLLNETELATAEKLRKVLSQSNDSTDKLLEMLKKTCNNDDLMAKIDTWISLYNKA